MEKGRVLERVALAGLVLGGGLMLEGSTGRTSHAGAEAISGNEFREAGVVEVSIPIGAHIVLEMIDGSIVQFCRVGSEQPGMWVPAPESQSPTSKWAECNVEYPSATIARVLVDDKEVTCVGDVVIPSYPRNCGPSIGIGVRAFAENVGLSGVVEVVSAPWEKQRARERAKAARQNWKGIGK